MSATQIVVVGASLAGLRACESLRQEGFDGRIVLIGEEPDPPYDRPPLSKTLLAGDWEPDRVRLRKPEETAALNLDLRLGRAATALDSTARNVTLKDGTVVPFDGLIIATGSVVRRLPNQPSLPGIAELRTLNDSLSLRERLTDGHRMVVVGAGFIGLEVAATARQRGCRVTVLEGAPAPLVRGLGAEMGTAVAAVHLRNGVDLRCGVGVAGFADNGQRVTGVRLNDGEVVAADTVLVGIGVRPATDWLAGSGLAVGDGVICNETLQTSADRVFAAGDCARWFNPLFAEEMRVEHWTNAAEQGAVAAANLLAVIRGATPSAYQAVPFFWSDQFDSRVQFIGRAHGDDEVRVIAGDVGGHFAALYGYCGRLRGVLGVNMPKVVMPYRRLIAAGISWDDALARAGV